MKDKNCDGCQYAKWYTANGGFTFLGCRYPPLKGKWIAELEKCPKRSLIMTYNESDISEEFIKNLANKEVKEMGSVLMSIQPKWCELIASGKKTVEVRKTRPKIETPFKCYIYQTKKTWLYDIYSIIADWQGKVIGEFVCDEIETYTNYSLDEQNGHIERRENLLRCACMTLKEWRDYIGGYKSDFGYVWHISDLKIYDEPKELSEFKHSKEYVSKVFHSLSFTDWAYDCPLIEKINRPPQSWCYVEEAN